MDFLWIFVSYIAILGLPHVADAECVQDIGNSQAFQQCVKGYSMFMVNAASSMDPNDPNAMTTVICSTEGKAAIKCVLDYVKSCPDLMTSGETSAMLQGLQALGQVGGFDGLCDSISGPCAAVSKCLASQSMGKDVTPPSNPPTPFSVFQTSVSVICGPMKGMFECFKDVGDQCKNLEDNIKTVLNLGRGEAPAGSTLPTFEQTKAFTMQECQTLPADFASNTCVNNTVNSNMFVKCYENVTVNYPTENNKISCDAYRAGHTCVSMTIGKKCGAQYTDAFVKITPLFLEGMPSNCKLESYTSGSSLVQMSSFAIFAALILAFNLM